ncbi:histidine kinase [Teredinibacter haidensis]|uniref:histidine kinase n=1 Tax=Teredinibacter haidensis TaxID=2731755 RepID=UPI000A3F790B|nr:histidine kinase [Teredinibacter haidensis]
MIEGRVVLLNRFTQLAAVDIGCGQALVFHFPSDTQLDIGDHLEKLIGSFCQVHCLNRSKHMEVCVQMLSSPLPLSIARFVVTSETQEQELPISQVA